MTTRPTTALLLSLGLVAACEGAPPRGSSEAPPPADPHAEHAAAAAATPPAADDAPSLYGEALSDDRPQTALGDILGDPHAYAGQVVSTEGEIARVCQRMGCWMELREAGGPAVRIPMAGHSFFLPRDVAGRRARVEGTVAVRALSPEEQEHLRSEGATVLAGNVEIVATGVLVQPRGS